MGINQFFVDTLGANPGNQRWSWGAYDPLMDRVFLRVWEDDIRHIDGQRCVMVLSDTSKSRSPGLQERRRHVERIRSGSSGFCVFCKAVEPTASGARQIKQFDSHTVTEVVDLIINGSDTFAVLGRTVPTADLAHPPTAESMQIADLTSLINRKTESTQRDALIQARIGQGLYRKDLLAEWSGRCAVTGIALDAVLRASHIKPWRFSSDTERLDPKNGLPLIATLDALFDAGLISFSDTGELLVSPCVEPGNVAQLDLSSKRLSRQLDSKRGAYLRFHREQVFRSKN